MIKAILSSSGIQSNTGILHAVIPGESYCHGIYHQFFEEFKRWHLDVEVPE